MSLKIETRFSPSVVKAAQELEVMMALGTVPADSALRDLAHGSFLRVSAQLQARYKQINAALTVTGYDVKDCFEEMRADRVRKAKLRKEAQARREAEREMALQMIAA